MNGNPRSRPPAAPAPSSPALCRGERGDGHRIPRLLDRQSLLDPQLLRDRAHAMRARCAPRSPSRCGTPSTAPGSSSSAAATARLARGIRCASCAGCRRSSLRFDGSAYRTMLRNDAYWFSRLGVYHRARRQHRAHPRRQISSAAAGRRACRRPARLFPMGGDPALGVGAHRLSLGLSRERQAVAGRRPAHPQGRDAALAGELLREPGAKSRPHRQRLWPPGPGAAPGARGPGAAARTAGSRRSSRAACTSSSTTSSTTITGSAAAIAQQYLM